jgi:signal transduction histidine kinase
MVDFNLILFSILFFGILVLQVWAYLKLKKQNKIIEVQSKEIKTQIRELAEQNKLLKELNEEKQHLISIVSHDLKGPFNRIFALIQLMSIGGDRLNEEQREYLGKIHQIVNDGLSMVRNLIDNRKLEDHLLDMRVETFDLAASVYPLIKHYSTLAEKKKIKVSSTRIDRIGVEVDRQYLIRIIENLLSNAIKFSQPLTHVEVNVRNENGDVFLSISDQGPGISKEDQTKMFVKYQKLSAKPTSGESSTGLGLFIVKTLADKMKVGLTCESEIDRGTTFTLKFKKAELLK